MQQNNPKPISFNTQGLEKEEYKIHLRSIDSTFYPGHIIDSNIDTSFNANTAFVEFIIKHSLEKPGDIQYVSNRAILPKFTQTSCDSLKTSIKGTLSTGEAVEIMIETGRFDAKKHRIIRYKEEQYGDNIQTIDGQNPYGGTYMLPAREIHTFTIRIDGKPLDIPKEAYQNLFEPNICTDDGHFFRKTEAYSSLNEQLIYVYIYGSDAAGTYFSKLIFSREKYLTKIVADYYALSMHGSFRSNFIGF